MNSSGNAHLGDKPKSVSSARRVLSLIALTVVLASSSLIVVARTSASSGIDRFIANNLPASIASGLIDLKTGIFGAPEVIQATIKTDKPDYAPGETAIITGTGFVRNSTITLQVVHIEGWTEEIPENYAHIETDGEGHKPWEATSDEYGNVTTDWYVHPDDSLGATFLLTATDGTSTARTTFTDGNVRAKAESNEASTEASVDFYKYSTANCSGPHLTTNANRPRIGAAISELQEASESVSGTVSSIRLTASDGAIAGQLTLAFKFWRSVKNDDSFIYLKPNPSNLNNWIPSNEPTSSICFADGSTKSHTFFANYGGNQATATTLTVDDATGPFNGTVDLKATSTAGGAPVIGQNVQFYFLPPNSPKVPVGEGYTNTEGVATATGVSLSGIPAAVYLNYITAESEEPFVDSAGINYLGAVAAAKTLTVTPPANSAPVATAQWVTTSEDVATAITLTGTDADNNSLTYSLVTSPSNGQLSGTAPNLTYTPLPNFNGLDSFTFKANDGTTDSAPATISITVNAVNDAPTAQGDSYSTDEDVALNVALPGVLANDTDIDGPGLTAVQVSGPLHGTLNLNPNGSFTYVPTLNYSGSDSFTYKANDGTADSSSVTVSITVNGVNDAPTSVNDAYSTDEDTALNVSAAGVLSNDSDAEAQSLSASLVAGPAHGTLSLNANGSFTYTPASNYSGSDSFTYRASDGTASGNIATVNITVNSVNDAPTCSAGSGSTDEDTELNATLSCTDTDSATLTYSKASEPAHGTLMVNLNGSFTYTPTTNYSGTDSFTFKTNDGTADSAAATFEITVTELNDAPDAVDDTVATPEDQAITVDVLDNDTDADGDALRITAVTPGSHGLVVINNTNGEYTVTYTPTANFNGVDSFTYAIEDGKGGSDIAQVNVTVDAVNDLPTSVAGGPYSVAEGGTVDLTGSGTDIEGEQLIYAWDLDNDPSATFETEGQNPTFSAAGLDGPGARTITLKVCDASGGCQTATANVDITNVAPTATLNAPASADEGSSLEISLSEVVDPFTGDTPFEYAFDCGAGTFGDYSTTPNASCSVSGANNLTVRGKVKDKDGGESVVYSKNVGVRASTTLTVPAVVGTYGGTVVLTATLKQTTATTAISNKSITFTLSGSSVGSAPTDSNGTATLSGVSLTGINAGSFTGSVVASYAGDTGFQPSDASGNLTVNKAASTTSFTTTAPQTLVYQGTYSPAATTTGDGTLTINATGSCSFSGGVVTMTSGTGNCVVTATTAEGTNYLGSSATPNQTIAASKANQTITFTGAPATAVYNTTFSVAASASSGLSVQISDTPGVCSISVPTVTMMSGTGTCSLTATQGGDDNFNSAAPVTQLTNAQKALATLTLGALTQTYDGTPRSATVNPTPSGLAYTVTYTGVVPTVYLASTVPPTNAGTYSVTASVTSPDSNNYQGSSTEAFVINKKPTSVIGLSPQTLIYGNNIAQTATVDGGPGGETVNYTLASGLTATTGFNTYNDLVNAGDYTLKASYAGGNNHDSSEATASVTVNKTDQTITWSIPSAITYGTPLTPTQLNATVSGVNGGTAAGVLTYNPVAATVLSAGTHTLSVKAAETNNYNEATKTVSLVVNPANTSTEVSNASATFSNPIVPLSATVTNYQTSAAVNEGTVTFTVKQGSTLIGTASSGTVTGGNATASFALNGLSVGSYQIYATYNPGNNFNVSSDITPATLTIGQLVTAGAVTVSPKPQQYSDDVTFAATLSPASAGGQSPATTVTFYVGTQNMGNAALTTGTGIDAGKLVGTLTVPLLETSTNPFSSNGQMAPGSRQIRAVFGNVNSNFAVSDATTTLEITPEDARATYTGATFASTSSATSSVATVTLSATIQDITAVSGDAASDSKGGDIRNAKVTFAMYNGSGFTNITGCTNLSVGLVGNDTFTGAATCNWSANIGNTDSVPYTIATIVTNYYQNNSAADTSVVTVSKAIGSGFITGGGYLQLSNSSGIYAGDVGSRNNFGFNVKYTKSGTNLQGNINTIVRRTAGGAIRVYQIKGNVMTSLVVKQGTGSTCPTATATNPCTAIFNGKASIQDITNPLLPLSVDGNATLQVTMTDKGEPGIADMIGVTVWNKSGGVWFASSWDGVRTREQTLKGGNLVVH